MSSGQKKRNFVRGPTEGSSGRARRAAEQRIPSRKTQKGGLRRECGTIGAELLEKGSSGGRCFNTCRRAQNVTLKSFKSICKAVYGSETKGDPGWEGFH